MLSICLLIIEIPFKVDQSGSVQARKIFKVDRLAPENIKVTRSGSRKFKVRRSGSEKKIKVDRFDPRRYQSGSVRLTENQSESARLSEKSKWFRSARGKSK